MDWIDVLEQTDINDLLEKFGYFHDGCLKELHLWTETYVNEDLTMHVSSGLDTNVRILFQRQFKNPSAIELLFEGVTNFHIIPSPENYDSIIYDAIILKHDGHFYWANNYEWNPEKDLHSGTSWISARNLKWRDASNWLGQQIRYSVQD